MANYLKFDVYEAIRDTSNRSIIVIEDIDCHNEAHARPITKMHESDLCSDFEPKRKKKATLSGKRFTLTGLLNYMDGVWSSCGEERIIVFTMNNVERRDPALLRPGRMDMHIELSFCRAKAFRILASNYLEIKEHRPLFDQIDVLLERIDVTPAVVAEQLLRHEDPNAALEAFVKFLKKKGQGRSGREERGR